MSDVGATPPPPPPPTEPPGGAVPGPYGAGGVSGVTEFGLDAPLEIDRWRPFVHWLLAIPLVFVLAVYGLVTGLVSIGGWFAALFSGRLPEWAVEWITRYGRFQWRVYSYAGFMRKEYPSFSPPPGDPDPHDDPAAVGFSSQTEPSRGLLLVKWLILFPHYVVLYVLSIAVGVVQLIAAFAILFTGAWPEGMRRFVIGYYRWSTRVYAYLYMLSDEYPPFSLD